MKYEHLIKAFYSTPWAILPEKLAEIRAFLDLKASGGDVDPDTVKAIAAGRRSANVQMAGRVALVPVMGILSQRASMVEEASGAVSAEALGATLDSLVADKSVKAIVLAFDSPGGSVLGIQELADKIRGYRGEKKIVGIADSIAASAAYWLACQCQELSITPGGQVGSIGVIAMHMDWSKAYEQAGVKPTIVTSAPYKADGAPEQPLSEAALADMQGKVNGYHATFVASVARGRGVSEATVRNDFGQGRMLLAKPAVDAGMADRVATLAQVINRLGGQRASGGSDDEPPPSNNFGQACVARARAVEAEEFFR